MTTTRIRPCGEAALLLDCADLAEAVALAETIERARIGAVDVVAAARTVLVTARRPSELPRLRRALEVLLADGCPGPSRDPLPVGNSRPRIGGGGSSGGGADVGGGGGSVLTLDVHYDGPDLADVAELAGVSTETLVRIHTSITWKAAFGGFAPGFFYLVDIRELEADADADGRVARARRTAGDIEGAAGRRAGDQTVPALLPTVPRLDSPRPRVPAGSVAVADRFCAVYPGASPGGWRLLGTTDAPLWDVDRPRPALLAPGTLVRFRDIAGGGGGAGGRGSGGGGGRGDAGGSGGGGGRGGAGGSGGRGGAGGSRAAR